MLQTVGEHMDLILNSFAVFALTLILTKSKVLAGKREFVEQRYEASKVNNQDPGWTHRWWHAMWTCPMCSGFWASLPICYFFPYKHIFIDVLVVFGANWLLHCLENMLFFTGEVVKQIDENETFTKANETMNKVNQAKIPRDLEKTLKSLDKWLRNRV